MVVDKAPQGSFFLILVLTTGALGCEVNPRVITTPRREPACLRSKSYTGTGMQLGDVVIRSLSEENSCPGWR